MGVNNKQRRAAKARQRAKQRAGAHGRSEFGGWSDESVPSPAERVHELWRTVVGAALDDRDDRLAAAASRLAASDARLVDTSGARLLLGEVAACWEHGWLPAELIRHAHRAEPRAGRLAAVAVAVDHGRRDRSTLHPRWIAHVDALELAPADAADWLAAFADAEGIDRRLLVSTVVALVAVLATAGPLSAIVPPPGANAERRRSGAADLVDDPVLAKVRALLAQAESTTFEAEATAFTAKAQELMARHAIDAAVVWASTDRDEQPITIRLPIDDPYADIKSLLVQRVASRSRCSAVYHPRIGLTSIVGFASDVAATDLLFTSLLVQSQTALRAEAAAAPPGGRARSRSFRSSFLFAFTDRIDQRLAEINAAVESTAAADHAGSLLPVLALRDGAVEDAVRELFGPLQAGSVRAGRDAAGWVRGRLAADLAELHGGAVSGAAGPPEL